MALLTVPLVFLASCGDEGLHASDASIEHMFHKKQQRLITLLNMAMHDHVEVLYLMTHESEPSDTVLPEERWRAYDAVIADTGVRSLHSIGSGYEMELGFSSDDFMHKGMVKGILYSREPLAPLVESLDGGVPLEILANGSSVAYRPLGPNWYLFVRQD